MKTIRNKFVIVLLLSLTLFSCRKEEMEIIEPPEEEVLANSVAILLQRTATTTVLTITYWMVRVVLI